MLSKTFRLNRKFVSTRRFWPGVVTGAFCLSITAMLCSPTPLAAAAPYTLTRGRYNMAPVQSKNYAKTTLARLVSAASSEVDRGKDCKAAWKAQAKLQATYSYFCWRDSDLAKGWTPQGITGSGSAQTSADNGNNKLLLVSWYTSGSPSLVTRAETKNGSDASRMSIVDMKRHNYRHVELAKPCDVGNKGVCKLDSHAGGIAWAGRYIYVASTTGLFIFDTDNLFMIEGKPVLVASEWLGLGYTTKKGEMSKRVSTISFDSSANQLVTTEYRDPDSQLATHVVRWKLDSRHMLSGETKIQSVHVATLHACCLQGIARYNGVAYGHSSSATVPGRDERGGALFKWRSTSKVARYEMPYHMQSAYIDTPTKRMWALTEPGAHADRSFVFSYPLKALK